MTTDLVTYYGQTPIIDQLVDKYGVYLEKLDREDKLLLRMTLANYAFMQEHSNPDKYTVEMALEDVLSDPGFIKRPLAKVLFARGGKREKVKGEGENTKPFPLSPSPFPDFCKKSKEDWCNICSVLNGLTTLEAETILEALQHQIRWGNARQAVN
ncbi:hypothetical protein COO91_09668 (plasmid) [Nostoc flagelliforme CCNUN1]|uniref:Uncharacterized protein n=1 Tax=Nostoc flagelliforme CCNUN1 TaxID=2038116 RepID=A0A2K8T719_9NOSO|nr:hypothetical protein [Nostoc flagelliforme]AUB43487.1 hypothetical protein COO91_09668 [Nostoc flagelliforme CCNUN1]